jgi:hypothetical protein
MAAHTRLTADFDLVGHIAEMSGSPGKSFKETRLGKRAREWVGTKKHLSLALALLEAVPACQDKTSQEVLLDTLAALLHRDLPFTQSHLDLMSTGKN